MSRAKDILERLEMAGSVRVSINPTSISRLAADLSLPEVLLLDRANTGLRCIGDPQTKSLYFWDAHLAIHQEMADRLGLQLAKREYQDGDAVRGDSTGFDTRTSSTEWMWQQLDQLFGGAS